MSNDTERSERYASSQTRLSSDLFSLAPGTRTGDEPRTSIRRNPFTGTATPISALLRCHCAVNEHFTIHFAFMSKKIAHIGLDVEGAEYSLLRMGMGDDLPVRIAELHSRQVEEGTLTSEPASTSPLGQRQTCRQQADPGHMSHPSSLGFELRTAQHARFPVRPLYPPVLLSCARTRSEYPNLPRWFLLVTPMTDRRFSDWQWRRYRSTYRWRAFVNT